MPVVDMMQVIIKRSINIQIDIIASDVIRSQIDLKSILSYMVTYMKE
ncbi:MAG: hypothetical protein WCF97_11990 [Nitrososphaeraceae archaeon]